MQCHAAGSLVDRALDYLGAGPVRSERLAATVMGIQRAPALVADRLATALLGADPRVRRLPDGRWSLVHDAGPSPAIDDCVFAVVDVETTGTSPARGDRIIEVAVVLLAAGNIDVAYETLVNPGRPIPRRVSEITRIDASLVYDKPEFGEIADEVIAALAGRIFVAHNVGFDWGFVSREVRRARYVSLDGPRICTVRLARRLIRGLKSRSLDSVARLFGIEIHNRHRAGGDALATASVLRRLVDLAREHGATTLQDLERLGRASSRRKKRRRRRSALPTSMDEV